LAVSEILLLFKFVFTESKPAATAGKKGKKGAKGKAKDANLADDQQAGSDSEDEMKKAKEQKPGK
jgi:hypothetical protein